MYKKNGVIENGLKLSRLALLSSVAVLIVACGGGGSGGGSPGSSSTLSCEVGESEYSGCWISESCNNFFFEEDGYALRYINQITEETSGAVVSGNLKPFLVGYKDIDCNGPIDVIKGWDTAANVKSSSLALKYTQLDGLQCTDIDYMDSLNCTQLEVEGSGSMSFNDNSFIHNGTDLSGKLIFIMQGEDADRLCESNDSDIYFDAFGDHDSCFSRYNP